MGVDAGDAAESALDCRRGVSHCQATQHKRGQLIEDLVLTSTVCGRPKIHVVAVVTSTLEDTDAAPEIHRIRRHTWQMPEWLRCCPVLHTGLTPLLLYLPKLRAIHNALDERHLAEPGRCAAAEHCGRAEEGQLLEGGHVCWQPLRNLINEPEEESPGTAADFLDLFRSDDAFPSGTLPLKNDTKVDIFPGKFVRRRPRAGPNADPLLQ